MWVNMLLFLGAVATAVYWYLTRNFGWFKSRGIYEHDTVFPMGCPEANQLVMGQLAFQRMLEPIYVK